MSNQSNQTLIISAKQKVFEDKKTHFRSIALPFALNDGSGAAIIITRLKNEEWSPKNIKSITITYND